MANLRITWNRPTIVPYAPLASVFPGVVWQNPQIDFRARSFRVQYRRVGDANWLEAGETRDTGIEIRGVPDGVYQARIATIDVTGRASAWVASGEQGTIINWVARFSEPNHALALGVF
jgi:hypothetical protein